MAKRLTSEEIPFDWRRGKRKDLIEYYGRPSRLARELWLHVLGIGKSKCASSLSFQRKGNRTGYILHYVHRGELWHHVNDRLFRARSGEACLLDISQKFTQGNDRRSKTDLWWIYFDGKDVPRVRTELEAHRNPVFNHLDQHRVESLFQELWKLTVRQPPAWEAESHAILNTVLAELFVSRSRITDWEHVLGKKTALSDKVRMAVDFIERMHFQSIGLKHIAAAVGLNLHHLARRFHEEVGMAPIQYLNRFRIEQAKRLLATTDKSVSEVSRLVGIADARYCSRLFRKLTGQSPHSYDGRKRKLGTS